MNVVLSITRAEERAAKNDSATEVMADLERSEDIVSDSGGPREDQNRRKEEVEMERLRLNAVQRRAS